MSLPFSKVAAAQVALREAARALDIGEGWQPAHAGLDSLAARALAADVAYALDALAAVVQQVSGKSVPTSAAASAVDDGMQGLVGHIRDGASVARRISGSDGHPPRPPVTPDGRG